MGKLFARTRNEAFGIYNLYILVADYFKRRFFDPFAVYGNVSAAYCGLGLASAFEKAVFGKKQVKTNYLFLLEGGNYRFVRE